LKAPKQLQDRDKEARPTCKMPTKETSLNLSVDPLPETHLAPNNSLKLALQQENLKRLSEGQRASKK
jgi:hypothetical protein